MPNRIIKESICTSEEIDSLSSQAEILFYRLMVKADDYGLYFGNPKIIKSMCYPLKSSDINDEQIKEWLNELSSCNLIKLYISEDGKTYLKLTTWENHQQIRAKKSKFPKPDSNGYQMISDDCNSPRNPIQSESNPNPIKTIEKDKSFSSPDTANGGAAVADKKKLKERKKRTYDANSKYYKAAEWLAEQSIINSPRTMQKPTPAQMQNWADAFRLMEEQDKLCWNDIREVLLWAVNNDFWKAQILSAVNFRKHYNQLVVKMQQATKPPPTKDDYKPKMHKLGERDG